MFISELQAKQGKVDLIVEIVKKDNPREFDKDGRKGRVCNFMVKDKTGSIKLSLWNDDIDLFNVGDTVTIKNGYVSEWQGEKQLSTGKFGTIEKASPSTDKKEVAKDIEDELEEIEKKDEGIEKLDRLENETKKLSDFQNEEPSKKKDALTLDELEDSFDDEEDDEDPEEDDDFEEDEEISLVEEDVVDDDEEDKKD